MLRLSPQTRYYVHGDLHEQRPFIYYCAKCDSFEPAKHFDDPAHVSIRARKYRSSLNAWTCYMKKRGCPCYRRSDSENIIADLAVADIKAERAARSAFFRWLLRQTKRDDPIGDFASDVERDSSFPRTTKSFGSLRSYLFSKRASPEAILAFDEACVEFNVKRKARLGIPLTLRFAIFKRDEYRCCICGASAIDGVRLEIDHKIPVAKNGLNVEDNLWTLCFECNRGKRTDEL